MSRRVALYARVSTDQNQTVENQLRELHAAAARLGWVVVAVFTDEGVSGTKGRDQRPGYDALLRGSPGGSSIVAAWSVCRLGRSLQDLVAFWARCRTGGSACTSTFRARHHDAWGTRHVRHVERLPEFEAR